MTPTNCPRCKGCLTQDWNVEVGYLVRCINCGWCGEGDGLTETTRPLIQCKGRLTHGRCKEWADPRRGALCERCGGLVVSAARKANLPPVPVRPITTRQPTLTHRESGFTDLHAERLARGLGIDTVTVRALCVEIENAMVRYEAGVPPVPTRPPMPAQPCPRVPKGAQVALLKSVTRAGRVMAKLQGPIRKLIDKGGLDERGLLCGNIEVTLERTTDTLAAVGAALAGTLSTMHTTPPAPVAGSPKPIATLVGDLQRLFLQYNQWHYGTHGSMRRACTIFVRGLLDWGRVPQPKRLENMPRGPLYGKEDPQ